MAEKYSHYAMFGATSPPSCADKDGFLKWRDKFEKLPEKDWTAQERWIRLVESAVSLQATMKAIATRYNHSKKKSKEEPTGAVRTGGYKKPKDEQ